MEARGYDCLAAGVMGDEARAELDRLLSDPDFQSTERNKKFLRFVAREAFEGRESAIKAYSIAVDVFGRPSNFDPTTDPIVRIEATRLRASLSRYYEMYGGRSSVQIELPKGRYVPVFSRAPIRDDIALDPSEEETPAAGGKDEPRAIVSSARLWPSAKAKWTALAVGGLAGLCLSALPAVVGLGTGAGPAFSEKPSMTLDLQTSGAASDADLLRDSLMVAFSQHQTVRVLTDPMPTHAIMDAHGAAQSNRSSAYRVSFKYQPGPAHSSVWWQVVDTATGEVVRSGVEDAWTHGRDPSAVAQALGVSLATRLAGMRGVISDAEILREMAGMTLGNGCVLRAYVVLENPQPEGLQKAQACLEATLADRPNDADAHAALARVLLKIDAPDAPTELSSRALELANKSVVLAPLSDRSALAQMVAQFRNGQIEAALVSGRRALLLNPNNAAIPAKLGAMLFTIGRWDEGVALVIKAGDIEAAPYHEAQVTLAMNAYRRGDYDEALLRVQQMGDTPCYCANVLRAAALGQLGRKDAAARAAETLRKYREGVEKSFRSDMEARHFSLAMTDLLEAGLVKAGLRIR